MTDRAARYADWPRCDACNQALPRTLAEERGLVKPVQTPDALCKRYVINDLLKKPKYRNTRTARW